MHRKIQIQSMDNPKVSVVMCTYNGEKYIHEQIDSILNQTYKPYELIIQDDCSTDSTFDIINEYANTDNRIRSFRNESNLGFNRNFKDAIMKATGDYIAMADQDDVWFTEKIDEEINAIGNKDICYSDFTMGYTLDSATRKSPENRLCRSMFKGVPGHTMLCRRDFLQDNNNWIKKDYYDLGLCVNAYLHNGVIKVNKPLNWHRENNESAVKTLQNRLFPHKTQYAWESYMYGFKSFRNIQKQEGFINLYKTIYKKTSDKTFPLEHKLSSLLLKRDIISLIKLCLLCRDNREYIYPDKKQTKGISGAIRGFFFPFIFAYHNSDFYVRE